MLTEIIAFLKRPRRLPARRHLAWILALALVGFTLVGSSVVTRWQHRSGQHLATVGFGYGALIDAIDHTGTYRVCGVHYPGVCFSAHRLPLLPGFLMTLRMVCGDDQASVGLAKACLCNLFFLAAAWLVLSSLSFPTIELAALLLFPLFLPFWDLTVFEISVEEAYLIPILTALFATLWFSDTLRQGSWKTALGIGAMAASLVWLKHSMPYWGIAAAMIAGIRSCSWRNAALALAVVVGALVALAAFNYRVAGRFTVGSSWEGWTLYKGNNPETRRVYPWHSLDTLDYEGKVMADRPLRDEWDHNAYFKSKAELYIKSHPGEFLHNALVKAWVFFFEVRRTGLSPDRTDEYNGLHHIQSTMMVLFRAIQWIAIVLAIRGLWASNWSLAERSVPMSFLLFIVLYAGFHLVGFAYERHVMPLVTPTVLFLCWWLGCNHGDIIRRQQNDLPTAFP